MPPQFPPRTQFPQRQVYWGSQEVQVAVKPVQLHVHVYTRTHNYDRGMLGMLVMLDEPGGVSPCGNSPH